MTRSVTFGGTTAFHPGGLTRVNDNSLAPITATEVGIIGLLGEADGGVPGTVSVITVDDPAQAKELFTSGALADAIRVAFNATGDARIPGGGFRCICYKTNASTQAGVSLADDEGRADTSTAASTTTVITLTTGGLIEDAEIGRWLLNDTTLERRRIVDNDVTTITVDPGFSAAPADTDPMTILNNQITFTSRDYGSQTNQVSVEFELGTGNGWVITLVFEDTVEVSPEIGGDNMLTLKYVGGAVLDTAATVDSLTATTLNFNGAVTPSASDWDGLIIRFADGTQREIASHDAASPTAIVLTAASALSTADIAALEGTSAQIIDVLTADASITGTNGVSTVLTTAVTPVADDLSINFATLNLTTLKELVDYINGNTNYEAAVPDGVNGDLTLTSQYDFGTRNTAVDVRFDEEVDPVNKGSMRQDLQTVVNWVNGFSALATAARATAEADEGSEIPSLTGGVAGTVRDVPVYFTGGTRGISTNASWQAGFDALLQIRMNHIVPLMSQDLVNEGNSSTATYASVAAQLKEHVKKARTVDKNEQGGYTGMNGTQDELLAQIAALNDEDIELMGQKMSFLDVDGTLKEFDEWGAAVAAASMRSGAQEVGEPLTFKNIGTTTLSQDNSWDPANRTDSNQMLEGGLMFAEVANTTIRWVRDLTTHITSDNIAKIDGNTRDAVRFVAYDLRTFLEERFTGIKATAGTVASIREAAAAHLTEYLTDNILVESSPPEDLNSGIVIPGWRSLRVFITGNVATIRVEIFPVTGIVFQLNDIFLQLPILTA